MELVKAIQKIMPLAGKNAYLYISHLQEAMDYAEINTIKRKASFLAHIAVESAQLNKVRESLYYKDPIRLMNMFEGRFTRELADRCIRNPELTANYAYCDKYGNGSFSSGQGWLYIGRGLIQITFYYNYEQCGKALNLPLIEHPELLEEPRNAAMSAAWFWKVNNLNFYIDRDRLRDQRRKINAKLEGLNEVNEYFKRGLLYLKDDAE